MLPWPILERWGLDPKGVNAERALQQGMHGRWHFAALWQRLPAPWRDDPSRSPSRSACSAMGHWHGLGAEWGKPDHHARTALTHPQRPPHGLPFTGMHRFCRTCQGSPSCHVDQQEGQAQVLQQGIQGKGRAMCHQVALQDRHQCAGDGRQVQCDEVGTKRRNRSTAQRCASESDASSFDMKADGPMMCYQLPGGSRRLTVLCFLKSGNAHRDVGCNLVGVGTWHHTEAVPDPGRSAS